VTVCRAAGCTPTLRVRAGGEQVELAVVELARLKESAGTVVCEGPAEEKTTVVVRVEPARPFTTGWEPREKAAVVVGNGSRGGVESQQPHRIVQKRLPTT